ncbi:MULTISPECIES: CHAP domain-containing protein [Mammaliicoccus]|uniref:CHAP domain-containing protein n=1 Tax=Mammaliicoccus fleurettii TaxID=150056 RepID=A0ABS5MJ56_9STAP|nr:MULTISPECIES: CHAP domain-containing protein [Mammaliicoccus]MBL0846911.1 CHAP domain-containing protein [Mammaliicoccus fleurettii]MBS3670874.1 CHAP domain-containing protein [Mammaliicoccus fleurettii]MBS3695933.1 CHAP domain-containing protein [Mammaliicoccus fleurettii]PTE34876.1 CHAP domain-containing protein [Mammaliicoccus fleurettii]RIL53373.1 CHAP domain-containing protein [Mammaliicoccus fleurettii]
MKIKSKLLLAIAFTSLTALNMNMNADAKDGGGSDTSKDKTPKIQNVEIEHRDYDKKSSKVQKEVAKSSTAAMNYIYSLEGKGWDFDGYYGWQCFDLVNYYWNYLYGHGLHGDYAKDIPTANNFSGEATVYKNSPSFVAKPGDIVVFNGDFGSGAGHTAIVLNGNADGNLMQFQSLDQNWYGGGTDKTEVAQRVTHDYESEMWFIRPN